MMDVDNRDKRNMPLPGDCFRKRNKRGTWMKRVVVSSLVPVGNEVYYESGNGRKTCWITTWRDWAKDAEVYSGREWIQP